MSFFLSLFLAFLQLPAASPRKDLNTLVKGVERSFATMKDFSADFVQIVEDSLNRRRQESGHLYLMRPRMMRFEYKSPEETYFISDGKTVYLYVPADKQVNKDAVKEALDDRIPLMFLLGRSNLSAEFTKFEEPAIKPYLPGTRVIRMFPKRKTELTEIVMEVDPSNYQVRRLAFNTVDGQRSEFIFSNIRTNTGLRQSLFQFKVPPGVQIVEGIGQ